MTPIDANRSTIDLDGALNFFQIVRITSVSRIRDTERQVPRIVRSGVLIVPRESRGSWWR